jgi:class 3 adenylate cyclase
MSSSLPAELMCSDLELYAASVIPETRYARAGDLHIAYQTVGEGSTDIVLADQWFSNVDAQWDVAPLAELRRRLASFGRLILFDKRGVGISDPVAIESLPSIETWMDDLRAVMDAASSERAALITTMAGTMMSLVFAASHPDRVRVLVIVDGAARMMTAPDYPAGRPVDEYLRIMEQTKASWGRGMMLDSFAPSMRSVPGLRDAWSRYERAAASPGTAEAMIRNLHQIDVREVLPAIRVPTLVIQHSDALGFRPDHGRYLAAHIPGAKYLELPGVDSLIWAGDQARLVGEIEEFVTGTRQAPASNRVLATVLFTDIVDSTKRAAELGDDAWGQLLGRHDQLAQQVIEAFAGRVIQSTGDGILATFDGPARGVRAAREFSAGVHSLDLRVRAGLHAGEIELAPHDVSGIAVHIGARVAALAGTDEILVTSTVKELVVGSGLTFVDRGLHDLKGVPDKWRLYAIAGPEA